MPEKSFEEQLNRLKEIVSKVEGEVLPLEESLALYEEGKKIISALEEQLTKAEELVAEKEEDKDL